MRHIDARVLTPHSLPLHSFLNQKRYAGFLELIARLGLARWSCYPWKGDTKPDVTTKEGLKERKRLALLYGKKKQSEIQFPECIERMIKIVIGKAAYGDISEAPSTTKT